MSCVASIAAGESLMRPPILLPRLRVMCLLTSALTGCPILVNTSFNVRGEPIVCTPEDAFRCFMGNELDMLVIGNCVLRKADQDPGLKSDYSWSLDTD